MTDTQTPETANEPQTLPTGAISHPSCGSWWSGLSRAHCPACHRTFSVDSAAEKHRKGPHGPDRHCVDPATVGLVAIQKPYGVLWQNPGSDDRWADREPVADNAEAI